MKCKEVIEFIEDWAPKGIAWKADNTGFQLGYKENEISNIMLSLDLNEKVIKESVKKNCNLIITHHPLLFNPVKSLDFEHDGRSGLIRMLIKNDISLYSAHTNLDFTKDGVSFQLAKKLNLQKIRFLKNLEEDLLKLAVFVPASHLEEVAESIHHAGGGIIGEYSHCSFRTAGTGTFRGSEISKPAAGSRGKLELVEEIKLEALIEIWKVEQVISALKKSHPYEEVAYDLFSLKNKNINYGIGAIGEFNDPMKKDDFLKHISKSLKVENLRFVNGANKQIKTVAACGGSCSELINDAISNKADAFITADIKYHTFLDAEGKLLLVDAGHYETEIPVLDEIERRLKKYIGQKSKVKIFKFKGSPNPRHFFNKVGAH